jgi:hypothetical protein
MALEQGARYGYNRAYKHIENPSADMIVEHIVESIMNSLDDWFIFEDEYETN